MSKAEQMMPPKPKKKLTGPPERTKKGMIYSTKKNSKANYSETELKALERANDGKKRQKT